MRLCAASATSCICDCIPLVCLCRGASWRSAKRNRLPSTAVLEPAQKRPRQLAPTTGPRTATAPPQPHKAALISAQPNCLAPAGPNCDPNADPDPDLALRPQSFQGHMGPHVSRVCGGCAFSDTAATSAMLHKLQAELAQAKTALQDRAAALQQSAAALQAKAASEEALQRQKQELEASCRTLHGQVMNMLYCSAT